MHDKIKLALNFTIKKIKDLKHNRDTEIAAIKDTDVLNIFETTITKRQELNMVQANYKKSYMKPELTLFEKFSEKYFTVFDEKEQIFLKNLIIVFKKEYDNYTAKETEKNVCFANFLSELKILKKQYVNKVIRIKQRSKILRIAKTKFKRKSLTRNQYNICYVYNQKNIRSCARKKIDILDEIVALKKYQIVKQTNLISELIPEYQTVLDNFLDGLPTAEKESVLNVSPIKNQEIIPKEIIKQEEPKILERPYLQNNVSSLTSKICSIINNKNVIEWTYESLIEFEEEEQCKNKALRDFKAFCAKTDGFTALYKINFKIVCIQINDFIKQLLITFHKEEQKELKEIKAKEFSLKISLIRKTLVEIKQEIQQYKKMLNKELQEYSKNIEKQRNKKTKNNPVNSIEDLTKTEAIVIKVFALLDDLIKKFNKDTKKTLKELIDDNEKIQANIKTTRKEFLEVIIKQLLLDLYDWQKILLESFLAEVKKEERFKMLDSIQHKAFLNFLRNTKTETLLDMNFISMLYNDKNLKNFNSLKKEHCMIYGNLILEKLGFHGNKLDNFLKLKLDLTKGLATLCLYFATINIKKSFDSLKIYDNLKEILIILKEKLNIPNKGLDVMQEYKNKILHIIETMHIKHQGLDYDLNSNIEDDFFDDIEIIYEFNLEYGVFARPKKPLTIESIQEEFNHFLQTKSSFYNVNQNFVNFDRKNNVIYCVPEIEKSIFRYLLQVRIHPEKVVFVADFFLKLLTDDDEKTFIYWNFFIAQYKTPKDFRDPSRHNKYNLLLDEKPKIFSAKDNLYKHYFEKKYFNIDEKYYIKEKHYQKYYSVHNLYIKDWSKEFNAFCENHCNKVITLDESKKQQNLIYETFNLMSFSNKKLLAEDVYKTINYDLFKEDNTDVFSNIRVFKYSFALEGLFFDLSLIEFFIKKLSIITENSLKGVPCFHLIKLFVHVVDTQTSTDIRQVSVEGKMLAFIELCIKKTDEFKEIKERHDFFNTP